MKKLRKKIWMLFVAGILFSCSTTPEPISYGKDSCHFCEMTIVSQAHAAQAVSSKGKQFKYDAIECMVHDLLQKQTEMAVLQVADYLEPGQMMPVSNARFIINDSINSPMGANLAAIKKGTGQSRGSLEWNELQIKLKETQALTTN